MAPAGPLIAEDVNLFVSPATKNVADTTPTKVMGKEGCPCARVWVTKLEGGRQIMRIGLDKGFSWEENVKPILPGTPDWCPATHFGYLEYGCMEINMKDGSKQTIKAGESYYVAPGHVPTLHEDTMMIEFTQDTTYTNKETLSKMNDAKDVSKASVSTTDSQS